jgi:hypothetical protein
VLLPVVAAHPRQADVRAAIVLMRRRSRQHARDAELGLAHVSVVSGDAGVSDTYAGLPRAGGRAERRPRPPLAGRPWTHHPVPARLCAPRATVI